MNWFLYSTRQFNGPLSMFHSAQHHALELLRSPDAEIYLQGAHLARFRDWLYLSPNAQFIGGEPIRGGVPVVFPWFGSKKDDPSAPLHGIARTVLWQIENVAEDAVTLQLEIESWRAQMKFEFGDALRMRLEVENASDENRRFECALHTYFAVEDVRNISIKGLDGKDYLDKTDAMKRKTQRGHTAIEGETDRVYLDSPGPIAIRDASRTLEIRGAQGWRSTVVWNPWSERAAQLEDLGDAQWPRFVCVECGAIADDAATLAPGETYVLDVSIRIV